MSGVAQTDAEFRNVLILILALETASLHVDKEFTDFIMGECGDTWYVSILISVVSGKIHEPLNEDQSYGFCKV